MFVLIRALTYSALFIGFLLVFLPAQLLRNAGIAIPETRGPAQVAGAIAVVLGSALAVWCILAFATLGRGTPAPFDPPRRLVVRGPYRFVRNPMYLGAALALAGAALFTGSPALLAYLGGLAAAVVPFVLFYEEPTLRQLFGADYEEYCRRVHRWLPTFARRDSKPPA